MKHILSVFLLAACASGLHAADWPQYRGPNRDDVSAETGLLKQWPAGGPPLVWTYKDAGVGYSGPAIVGDRLYTLGGRDETEFLLALDLKAVQDGAVKEAWAAKVGPLFQWKGNRWSAGPAATPTVDGELIYALGGNGDLVCVEAAAGKERWRTNLPKELEAQVNPIGGGPKSLGWGFTWSPLVDGDRLICIPGGPKGTVAALDKATGRVLWRSTEVTDQAAYTSPMAAEIGGVRQYVVLTNQAVFGVAAVDGRLLWRDKRRYGTEVVNSPLVHGPYVYTTVGAGGGSDLVKIVKEGEVFRVEPVYSNKNLANHHGNVLRVGEHVYGFSPGRGWVCQRFEDGGNAWEEKAKLRDGSVVYADGRLYCYTENDGTVALAEASPVGWRETGRFKIPQQSTRRQPLGRIWTPPVVAGGKLFLRDQELLFCFDVAAP
ncbi:MAG: PQQ-like beta-propeller repeat protein [Gemmataceae bacterium]|nr:PQQ-like beta-propeller repeat protein [Gemmataceae bacterium]